MRSLVCQLDIAIVANDVAKNRIKLLQKNSAIDAKYVTLAFS